MQEKGLFPYFFFFFWGGGDFFRMPENCTVFCAFFFFPNCQLSAPLKFLLAPVPGCWGTIGSILVHRDLIAVNKVDNYLSLCLRIPPAVLDAFKLLHHAKFTCHIRSY